MLNSTIRAMAVRAGQSDLTLECIVAPTVPRWVSGDPGRLRQVIINLLGNAIKFTDHGQVTLRVERNDAGQAEDDSCILQFSVEDSGIGIPPEKQRLIFDSFSQADNSTTRKFGGTGLGLTISLRLVGLMSGKIWVESEVGKGSTFHFTARFQLSHEPIDPADVAQLAGLEERPA